MRDMNVKCAAESVFDRSLGWSGETSNFQSVWGCMRVCWYVCVCVHRNACLCCLMMVGESEETGNYPRLQLIHILSSVLAQGSRVIWECDRNTHTHSHAHTLTKWEHMMHAGQIYGVGLWAPYISLWLLQPEPGWVQAVYSGWAGYLMPRRLFPLQPSGSHGSSFLTEND